ncbi:MAG: hypothetical protein WD716_05570 [Fimbriimonadaceae bacterium]
MQKPSRAPVDPLLGSWMSDTPDHLEGVVVEFLADDQVEIESPGREKEVLNYWREDFATWEASRELTIQQAEALTKFGNCDFVVTLSAVPKAFGKGRGTDLFFDSSGRRILVMPDTVLVPSQ